MPTTSFAEGRVTFEFHAKHVIKWDDEPAFIDGLRTMPSTKAVDFVVLALDDRVHLVEVKDFRGHRIENKRRLKDGPGARTSAGLAAEVAEKVRDTLAGMTWACRRGLTNDRRLEPVVGALYRRDNPRVLVALWLDEDGVAGHAETDALRGAIEQELHPHIPAEVVVTSLALASRNEALSWVDARPTKRSGRSQQSPRRK